MKNILMSRDPVSELRALHSVNALPESLAALDMPKKAGHSHKDVLDHSFKVLENAMSREEEPDLLLRTAALFHDVGKPRTRAFGERGKVTFDGHEHVGARMIGKILSPMGYDKDEVQQIEVLLLNHMRGYGYAETNWTDSALRRLITDTGTDEQMRRLLNIFYSDVTTRHDNKRRKIHSGVDLLSADLQRVKLNDARSSLRPALNGHQVAEITGASGRELGRYMKFLNSDAGVHLTVSEAEAAILAMVHEEPNTSCC